MKHVTEVHFNTTTKRNQFFLYKIPPEQPCTTPVTLPAETLHITKVYVTLSLLRPTQKAEELSKNFIYVEVHYVANAICRMCQKYKSKYP